MKNTLFISVTLGVMLLLNSCKRPNFDACISVDKNEAAVDELVTVSNCGEALPSRVSITIDWGDGTPASDGQTGTHRYANTGTYTIKLMANGDPLSERIDKKEDVEKQITIK